MDEFIKEVLTFVLLVISIEVSFLIGDIRKYIQAKTEGEIYERTKI